MCANFLSNGIVPVIDFNTDACLLELLRNFAGIGLVFFGDGDDVALRGRQPSWEPTCEMFDEHATKRSIDPNGARWIITGRCNSPSLPL